MMLNERQKQIFLCLDENKNSFIKGIELANKVNCSLKTLQNTVCLLYTSPSPRD